MAIYHARNKFRLNERLRMERKVVKLTNDIERLET